MNNPENMTDAIAIIGIGCRFPDAPNPDAFWTLLSEGRKAVRPVPSERWERSRYYDADPATAGKMNCCEGGFLENIDQFDAAFFGISDREAKHIDPQQRLFLEVAWEALEHANIPPLSLNSSATGVFTGLCTIDYHRLLYRNFESIGPHSGTGTTMSITANRLSYLLDLRGPSMAVDAACSSSLVGVHLACQSLRTQETDLCIAGGVNLILSPDSMISSSQTGLLSKQGECRPFDAQADGYVRGEGCGVVVLKRYSDAVHDGDRILALIRGSAVNQDGLSNSLSAPNGLAQQALIERSLAVSNVQPKDVDYVEAHAVGTALGDAIEFKALKKVLEKGRDTPCTIGSLKPNIGHLEAASGMASLLKVVMAMERETIPPQLNFEQPNSYVDLEENAFEITRSAQEWKRGARPRIAGISTFGFGGTNAHVVIAEPPLVNGRVPEDNRDQSDAPCLFVITAKSPAALRSLAQKYCDYIDTTVEPENEQSLLDICYSASVGRTHFSDRLCIVVRSLEQLRGQLEQFVAYGHCSQGTIGHAKGRKKPAVVFSFPELTQNNLANTLSLGAYLCKTQPLFKEHLNNSFAALGIEADVAESGTPSANKMGLAVYYALSSLWQDWGIQPKGVIGKGNGERVAACVAGLMALENISVNNPVEDDCSVKGMDFTLPKIAILSNEYSPLLAEARDALSQTQRTKTVDKKFPLTGAIGYDFMLNMGAMRTDHIAQYTQSPIEATPLHISLESSIEGQLLSHLATLFVRGASVNWAAFYQGQPCRKRSLPTYPFERRAYWFDSRADGEADSRAINEATGEPTVQDKSLLLKQ